MATKKKKVARTATGKLANEAAKKAGKKPATTAGEKSAKNASRKAAKKAAKKPPKASASGGLRRLKFDDDLEVYESSCRLDGRKVEVYLHPGDDPLPAAELRRLAEEVVASWPTLHGELCRLAREEIVASKRLSPGELPELSRSDVKPFSLTVNGEPDGASWWSFGLDVATPELHEEEYVDVSRAFDGSWTEAAVRSTE